jgi:hypothetical protein
MMDILFFVKTFILTVAIVLVMQIQVGDRSLETHAMGWVQSSGAGGPLGEVARGAAKMVHDVSHKVTDSIHDHVNKNIIPVARARPNYFPVVVFCVD